MDARERFNSIRGHKVAEQPSPPQGPQPSGSVDDPSSIMGQPGRQEWLERNGLVSPFGDDDDPFYRRVRGY
jgi:hypothetical protein